MEGPPHLPPFLPLASLLQAGNRRPDLRIYDAVVEALLENAGRISQLVVVTPLGGGGGTGFFKGGGGGGAGRLSPLERAVVESGVDYLVVRAAPSDRVTDRYGEQAATVVAPAGSLPGGLQASRSQVCARGAAAVAEAAQQSCFGGWTCSVAVWQPAGRQCEVGGPSLTLRFPPLPTTRRLPTPPVPIPNAAGGRRCGGGHGAGQG